LNISYCSNKCEKGKAAKEVFLSKNNSAIDAAIDFNLYIKECIKTCDKKNMKSNSDSN